MTIFMYLIEQVVRAGNLDNSQRWIALALEEWTTGAFDPDSDGADMYLNDSKYKFDWTKPIMDEWSLEQ